MLFPPEAPQQTLCYRNLISLHAPADTRTLLHFGAVDYETYVFLNGKEIGTHKGGHTPFSFDITTAVQYGQNELLVRIADNGEGTQLHGKQSRQVKGIWGANITGIWQTVWLEHVPQRSIRSLHFDSNIGEGRLNVKVGLAGQPLPGGKLYLTARVKGTFHAEAEGSGDLSLQFPEPLLWSPAEPNLYDLVKWGEVSHFNKLEGISSSFSFCPKAEKEREFREY